MKNVLRFSVSGDFKLTSSYPCKNQTRHKFPCANPHSITFTIRIINVPLYCVGHGDTFGDDFHTNSTNSVKKATGNVRALTYCDLHQISRDGLLDVLKKYPDFWEIFNREFEVTYNLSSEHEKVRHSTKNQSSVFFLKSTLGTRTLGRFVFITLYRKKLVLVVYFFSGILISL